MNGRINKHYKNLLRRLKEETYTVKLVASLAVIDRKNF
jgi:hypothetical protein